jgi:nucleoid-associated protein YgaU
MPPTSSTAPAPLVPLPTWLGGSQPASTGTPVAPATAPRRASPPSPEGGPGASRAGTAAAAGTRPDRRYVVRPGDTLWGIAAAHLGGHPAPARIDHYWRRIHAANVGALGHDPNLIHPGTRLVLPPAGPPQPGGG